MKLANGLISRKVIKYVVVNTIINMHRYPCFGSFIMHLSLFPQAFCPILCIYT